MPLPFYMYPVAVDVRVCPDAMVNCSTNFGKSECVSASGCHGGTSTICQPFVRRWRSRNGGGGPMHTSLSLHPVNMG